MLHLIIGHRGVGKTAFLTRVRATYAQAARPVLTYDLDAELARRHGRSVSALFRQGGEAAFRRHEHATLRALLSALPDPSQAADVYVSLGAGYDEDPRAAVPDPWQPWTRVLWLRRLTDAQGRVFIDPSRPRLDPALSPLAEYQHRFAERQARYHAVHDVVWLMPEGAESDHSPAESRFILSALASQPQPPDATLPAVLTVLPAQLSRPLVAHDFFNRRLSWPGLRFELRDDLLTPAQQAWVRQIVPPERIVTSYRRALPSPADLAAACRQSGAVDLPLELLRGPQIEGWIAGFIEQWSAQRDGRPQPGLIVSLHEREPDESLAAAAARLLSLSQRLGAGLAKLAVEVADFAQLADGLAWSEVDPQHRAFLPRTPAAQLASGAERWRWFRAVQALRQRSPLTFVREGDGSSPDQPTLCEHWGLGAQTAVAGESGFAAVLGDPVQHSRSPSEHRAFFAAYGLPVLAIPCREADVEQGALSTLRRLGLRFAAVTAPLKRWAGSLTGLAGCNTLWLPRDDASWQGDNTDPVGLQALLSTLPAAATVTIWGGGGVLPSIQAVLPQARAYALRTGARRDTDDASASAEPPPSVVLWAAGHHSRDAGLQPPASWRPQVVYDLDYREDSAGRDYALRVGARYVSGQAMFTAQAAAQRQIWQRALATSSERWVASG